MKTQRIEYDSDDSQEEDKDNKEDDKETDDEYAKIYGPDVYKIDNEWGTLVSDKLVSDKSSKGIFNLILQAVAN